MICEVVSLLGSLSERSHYTCVWWSCSGAIRTACDVPKWGIMLAKQCELSMHIEYRRLWFAVLVSDPLQLCFTASNYELSSMLSVKVNRSDSKLLAQNNADTDNGQQNHHRISHSGHSTGRARPRLFAQLSVRPLYNMMQPNELVMS